MFDSSSIQVIRSKRKTMTLHVGKNREIIVRAPLRYSDKIVHKFIEKNTLWIEKQMVRVVNTTKQYMNGEKFWYLGIEHELGFGNHKSIEFRDKKLLFPEFLKFRIEKELLSWYQAKAREFISAQLDRNAVQMEVSYLHVTFSETKSKWGSCSPENALQFNWKLVMAPPAVINYVIVHELAHTKEKNHGRKFWQIVSYHSPAYKTHRNWLKKFGDQLVI